jgi:hypothetical protein
LRRNCSLDECTRIAAALALIFGPADIQQSDATPTL